jgi:probable LLM family oxidoreductase
MQLGIDSFVPTSAFVSDAERAQNLIREAVRADEVGLDLFAIGEHHRDDFLASSPSTFLAAIASRTERILLGSAVTVLSSEDPVRVYQQFATIDLISGGRAEIVVGRGSFVESYPLFGFDLNHYDELFAEKLDLLLKLRNETEVTWTGKHRASLFGQGVYPRAVQRPLPVRIGVGGTPASFARAGRLGLPLSVAIIGGDPRRFRPLINLYWEEARKAGHDESQLSVGIHSHGYIAETDSQAVEELLPGYLDMMNRIGQERGWPPSRRENIEHEIEHGSLYVGSPKTVAEKIIRNLGDVGNISRLTLLMDGAKLTHAQSMRNIELYGMEVAPLVRAALP